ncbi:MAG: hypothetical protein IJ068_07050 [Bacilli bacterium]|nr:hypothetical protein [Bacilli bacterium]
MAKKRRRRKKRIFVPKIQTTFCILSLIFILACFIFYGTRLYKYYKIYNPKNERGEVLLNLPSKIIDDEEVVESGDGLYLINGNYVYKGENVNNYILINDILFRILRVNSDKTVDLVMDDYVNKVMWNKEVTTYDKSSIKKYLESTILPIINKDYLTTTTYCTDRVYELSEVSCEETNNDSYIRLLGINDYLNSLNNDKTFIGEDYVWLYNVGKNNAWHTTNKYISNSSPSTLYGVKGVITLKNSITYLKGDGTIDNPYILEDENEEINVGTYLDINDNVYIVYEVGKDYLKVESNKLIKEKQLFDKTSNDYTKSSLRTYLEKTYLDKLKINDYLKEVEFEGYKGKIGILSSDDLKFNSTLNNYYLSDTDGDEVVVYNGSVSKSSPSTKRNIRYALGIKKDLNIISGNGTKYAPFIVEVK